MTRRPVGVVLSAIVLGGAALVLCLMAASSVLAAALFRHMPAAAMATSAAPPSSAFVMGIMAFSAVFYLALAAWALGTLVGLVRMRFWARISVMIIGGGLVAIGLLSALGTAMAPLMLKSMPLPPNANPARLHLVFVVIAMAWLIVAAIGIWWLVYFALRRTRDVFAFAAAQRGLPQPNIPQSGVAAGPSFFARYTATPTPIDFRVAQPLEPVLYPEPTQPAFSAESYAPPAIAVSPPASPSRRPVSITIIAVLMLIGSLTALLEAMLPIPLFLFGVMLTGWTAHVTLLVFAVLTAIAGTGLIRLQKPAWVLTFAVYGLGILNTLSMLLPGVRQRLVEYSQSMSQRISTGLPAPQLDQRFLSFSLAFGAIFALLFFAVLLVLLWRARWAFESATISRGDHASA